MKKLFFYLFLSLSTATHAQTNADYLKQINRDVWLPFSEAYATYDAEKYKNIHTPDLIRGEGDRKRIRNFTEYMSETAANFKELKDSGSTTRLELRFLERFANAEFASERGIYYYYSKDKMGRESIGYGKFHVFLRKINGRWKIAIDYDSNEKDTVDKTVYLAAFGLEDVEKY